MTIKISASRKHLEKEELYRLGEFDKAGRWWPIELVAPYFTKIRTPSRAWPLSYWKAGKTQKFLKWCKEHGIVEVLED